MKASHISISILISAMLLSSCEGGSDKGQQTLEEITKQELVTALAERDELLALVKEVSNGLQQIKRLENMMAIAATSPAENPGNKSRMLADIASLKAVIQQRKDHLQMLEEKLQGSTINNKELQETIGALRLQIDSQIEGIESMRQQLTAANERIGLLNIAVDSLNSTISTIAVERDVAQETSARLESELNTCYYIVATKPELKAHNILESGFMRKSKLMKGDFDKASFAVCDKRTLDTLALNAKKAKLLTNHPSASYHLIEMDGGKAIVISDPQQFWSLSNYLVIQRD